MYKATVNAKTNLQISWQGEALLVNDQPVEVSKAQLSDIRSHLLLNGKSMNVELVQMNVATKQFTVKVNNRLYDLQLSDRYDALLKSLGMESVGVKKMKDIKAPMPGMVLNILVQAGDTVEKDTPILILEAMKMENVIKSPTQAVVKKVHAVKGVAVEKNAVLIEFE
jgi:biotin carboxyl carrier protein